MSEDKAPYATPAPSPTDLQAQLNAANEALAAERETNAILAAGLKPFGNGWNGWECYHNCGGDGDTHDAGCKLDAAFKEIERRKMT